MLAAVLMAAFALVQYFAGNGRFYWFYEHPFSSASDAVKGSFTNRNHFAQFLPWVSDRWFIAFIVPWLTMFGGESVPTYP